MDRGEVLVKWSFRLLAHIGVKISNLCFLLSYCYETMMLRKDNFNLKVILETTVLSEISDSSH